MQGKKRVVLCPNPYKDIGLRVTMQAAGLLREAGYELNNADCTILAQRPKLAKHIQSMRDNIAEAMSVPVELISVKATTEEGLGFTGSGEGIAAHAVVLINNI